MSTTDSDPAGPSARHALSRASTPPPTELLTFGPVHLDVIDTSRSLSWWRDVVGLQLLAYSSNSVQLGVEGRTFVVLRGTARRRVRQGYSGLYHLAINLPDEPAFAQTLMRLLSANVQLGTTDHVVAKSIYLADPDGIGLELTVEMPDRVRSIDWAPTANQPTIIDAQGRRREGVEPLDHEEVLAKLPHAPLPQSLPAEAKVGHVHLKVDYLEPVYRFYRDKLGLVPSNYVPAVGYGDLVTNDFRIHRIALNTWQGVGVPRRPPEMAGMDHVTIRFHSRKRLDEVLGRLGDAEHREDCYLVLDPAGNAIALSA